MSDETRARRRIRKAVESRGYKATELTWEPIYNAGEMAGLAGGWSVHLDRSCDEHMIPGDEIGGLTVEHTLADIDWSLRPSEPCACDPGRPGRHPLVPLRNDPEKPLHEASCRWYVAYRLRWWKRGAA